MTTTAVMRKQLFINGEWRDAAGGKTIEVVNPATEEVIAEVASAEHERRRRRGRGGAGGASTARGPSCRRASAASWSGSSASG